MFPRQKIVVVIFVGLMSVSSISCDRCLEKFFKPDSDIIGSWKSKSKDAHPLTTIKFRSDQVFEIDLGADGVVDILGNYEIFNNRIRLTYVRAPNNVNCYHSGFYNYVISRNDMSFDLFADECVPRKEVLSQKWESIPKISQETLKKNQGNEISKPKENFTY